MADVTIGDIQRMAKTVQDIHSTLDTAEQVLMTCVATYLTEHRGSGREIARQMGFSAAYVCDVQQGRRKISRQFVERLSRLTSP